MRTSHDLAAAGPGPHPELFHAVQAASHAAGRPRETSAPRGGAARAPRGSLPGNCSRASASSTRLFAAARPAGSATTAATTSPRSSSTEDWSRASWISRSSRTSRALGAEIAAEQVGQVGREDLCSHATNSASLPPRKPAKLLCASRNVSCTRSEASTLPWRRWPICTRASSDR